ncbi:Uma2 family endonuclease [Streptomyces tendae]
MCPSRSSRNSTGALRLHAERGLKTEAYRKGRARADGVLVPRGAFKGHGEWSAPDDALMAVEVTSWDADAARRDRVDKPDGYAAAGIPVYLLIDRESCSVARPGRRAPAGPVRKPT